MQEQQHRTTPGPASEAAPVQMAREAAPAGPAGATVDPTLRPSAEGAAPLMSHWAESGSGNPMPKAVQSRMEGAFGTDFSAVRIHEGGQAAALGAQAFTKGTDIHFAPGRYDPHGQRGQELLGHELAHVVQQSQGRVSGGQAKGAEINADPALEQEADDSGRRAARGEQVGQAGPVRGGGQVIQRYAETKIGGKDWRTADDLNMAIRQDSQYGSRFFYAEPGLIASSDATLSKQHSNLGIKAGSGTMKVSSPDGKSHKTLSRVEPKNKADGSKGNNKTGMQWPEDCGEAANNVMQGPGLRGKAVYSGPPEGFIERIIAAVTGKGGFERQTKAATYGTDTETYKGADFHTPHIFADEIIKAANHEKDAAKAWAKYKALSPADRDKFDQQVGINKYAQAEVGEAYSIVADKEDYLGGKSAWNFHWGGVAMRSGGDSVTMENFANSGTDAWDYQMYGPPTKGGQTFHEQQEQRRHDNGDGTSTPEYGDMPTTIRVRPEP